MIVSLLIPVLNEEDNIPVLAKQLMQTIEANPKESFEVLFVNDGSTDGTVRAIQEIQWGRGTRCKIISLSRNFGHQNALTAGYEHASGDVIVCLDADLQDPPEMIPLFLEKYREGYDVVYGVRQNRKEVWWMRLCFKAFYRIFNAIAERPMPMDAGDFGLVSNRVARAIAGMPEYDRMIRGLRSWVGFRQVGIPYNRPERFAGETRYRLGRRIEGALDGLFGYSKLPIRAMLFLGVFVFLIGAVYLVATYWSWFFSGGVGAPGWRSVITLAFMLGAANLVATSIVGEYVCRNYFQSKQRPRFVVSEIISTTPEAQHEIPVAPPSEESS
jgi:polyisoprenyl-phosphate glycosyltransferase